MAMELWQYRELIYRLVVRDVTARFRQSFLGLAWMVFPPIATTVVFAFLNRAKILNVEQTGLPYPVFVLIGTVFWRLFSNCTVGAAGSVAQAGNLVSKVYFPREILVLSAVGSRLVNTAVQFLVVCLALALYRVLPCWQAIFLPLLVLPLLCFALGLGLMFAPLNTMARDVTQALGFIFTFAMFLAPTVYPTPNVGILQIMHAIDPVAHFMNAARELIVQGQIVNLTSFLFSVIVSVGVLAIGWRFFHLCEPLFAERM